LAILSVRPVRFGFPLRGGMWHLIVVSLSLEVRRPLVRRRTVRSLLVGVSRSRSDSRCAGEGGCAEFCDAAGVAVVG